MRMTGQTARAVCRLRRPDVHHRRVRRRRCTLAQAQPAFAGGPTPPRRRRAVEPAPRRAAPERRLLVGRSTLVDIGTPIARVSLTSADVADALVTSPSQLLVHGKMPGAISMFVWDRGGGVKRYEIVVQRDLARLNDQIKQLFPGERSRPTATARRRAVGHGLEQGSR